MIKVSNWAATARSRVIGIGETVLDPSHRMFQSWFVVSDLQSDTYYYQDL